MAEVVVSAVAELLIAIISEQIQNEIHLVRGVDKEVLNLSDELKSLRNVLDDAENRRFQDKNINHWLSKLEETSYEMEDVLDEWNYALLKLKMADVDPPKNEVCSFIPSSCLCFNKIAIRRDIAKKIKNVIQKLNQISREKDRYNFVTFVSTSDGLLDSWRVQSTSLINLEQVHGHDRDRDILVGKLIDIDSNPEESGNHILSIVGMGGLGKTTLAQLVYNHGLVEKSFDLRIWICVSNPFDLAAIAKGILESIKKGSSPNTNQLDILFKHVKESITGKKFLLVLDDVWTEDHNKWEPLGNSLRCGGAGSKILVTTRNERVVILMGSRDSDICRPELLSDEKCWLLLRHMALPGRNEMKFEEIGKKIAQKCNGLPLAAKTLGSLLRFKSSVEEWENVLNSEIWKVEEVEVDIFPHLLLSYNDLSSTLKRCFSYCAVFPKDYEIDVTTLIGNWMALGYLGSNVGDMEVKGRECFDVLAMRSMFQDLDIDDALGEKITSCKMHDIVHDFAQFVRKSGRVEGARMNMTACQSCHPLLVSNVNKYCSLFWNDENFPPSFCKCLARLRVLSMKNCLLESIPQGMENLIHLRWLDLSYNTLSHENLKIIFQLYHLQTLKLSKCSLEEVPREIENLIHLRHLSLSENNSLKELPREMSKLIQLRHLDLHGNRLLKKLPSEIGNLIHLRYLDLHGNRLLENLPESICGLHELRYLNILFCKSLSIIPEGLAELTGLHGLTEFRGGSGRSKLGLLKKLNHLSGDLRLIINLGNDDLEEVVEDVREAELRNKIHLRGLLILFEDENEDSRRVRERTDVIDALEPHPNLQKMVIEKYMGSKLPLSWMVSPLNQIRKISLWDCRRLSSLPPLGKLPCLERIDIARTEGLEFVGREFLGIGGKDAVDIESSSNSVIAFPKLKKLIFRNCPKWKEWEDITAEEAQRSTIMPRLTHLIIHNCTGLTTLPRSLLSKAWPLEKMELFGSMELQQHCWESGLVFLDRS